MDKLLEVVEKQASSSVTVADFDENLFQQFLSKNPVWIFMLFQGMIIYVRVRLSKHNF